MNPVTGFTYLQRTKVIVMVTLCMENKRRKCELYWPEQIGEKLKVFISLVLTAVFSLSLV